MYRNKQNIIYVLNFKAITNFDITFRVDYKNGYFDIEKDRVRILHRPLFVFVC